ncbi:hypothetical protein [Streptomyces sp. NPDC058657]|uniref:hypothetical protein n=1 Tax=unclassified Streptomyces TaxID=2593676 RepID=UPI00364AEDAE
MSDFVHDKAKELADALAAGDTDAMRHAITEVLSETTGPFTERVIALGDAMGDHREGRT